MGADSSLLSPIACASHSSRAPFWPVQRIQRIPHNDKEILAWCLHNNKAERGTSKQPDKAPVSKERRVGRSQPRKPSELFFFRLSGAIDNCSTLCLDDPALQTHCLRQYITVPCRLPTILTERRHKATVSLVMRSVHSPQATPAESS